MARIRVPAVLAFYDDPHDLMELARKAREEKGWQNLDAYTPYPIHGMEEALGLRPSWVTTAARVGLIMGAFVGFMFQSWTSAVDWPINIGGKPFVSWPAWVPVTFECGVLLAGFTNLICLFIACGLYPRPNTIVLSKRITNDRFVLVVPARDAEHEREVVRFFAEHNAMKIKIVDGIDTDRQRVLFRAAPLVEEMVTA